MKVLIVHNEYRQRGGEEGVVEMQVRALRGAGYEVITYIRRYSEIGDWRLGRVRSFFTALYNREARETLRELVRKERPEVAFVHNLFPVISPAVLPMLKEEGVRTVMFVHNYRLLCPIALFYRQGKICEACVGKGRESNCVWGKCEGTLLGSIAFASRSYWSRKRRYYSEGVDLFVCLTRFQKERLQNVLGLPDDRWAVVPNAMDFSLFPPPTMERSERSYFAFVGRLSPEKGVELFFELARRLPQYSFRVAGEKAYEMANVPSNVEIVGFLNRQQLADFYSGAYATILTSRWYEGFPLVLLESMFYHTPSIVPDNDNLLSIVREYPLGKLYEADSIDSLVRVVEQAASHSDTVPSSDSSIEQQFSITSYVRNIENRLFVESRQVKFSIVTVCYNAAEVIVPTIRSVVEQRYSHVEYLIIDGGSTDQTIPLLEPYRHRMAVCLSEPDNGIYDAMNKGLQRATGDYVLFMNAGDQFHDDQVLLRIAEQLSLRKELPTVIYGDTVLIDDQRMEVGMRRLRPPIRLTWTSFRMGMLVCHQSFFVRRDVAPSFDLHYRLSADFDWCVRCLREKGEKMNSHLIVSSYLGGGMSVKYHRKSLIERFYIMAKWYGWVPTLVRHVWFVIRNTK